MTDYLPTLIAAVGSLVSGYVGVKVALVRYEERIAFTNQRLDKVESRILDLENLGYKWRHDEYAPEISHLWGELLPLKTKVERIERDNG